MTIDVPHAARPGAVGDPGSLAIQEVALVGIVGRPATLNGNWPGRESPLPPPQRETVAARVGGV